MVCGNLLPLMGKLMGKLKKQETEPHRYGVRKSSVNNLFMIQFLKMQL